MFQIPPHGDIYKFKKVWFYLQCFQFLLTSGSYTWQPPSQYSRSCITSYNIDKFMIIYNETKLFKFPPLQATTHANLLAGTRLQLLFTSLTVSNDIWKSLLLHHFEQKRTRTFNRKKTEDVAHTSLCVLFPIVNLNIAKGTTDPRVEFISQVQTVLIKFHLQNLDQESMSKSQPKISLSIKLKLQNLDQDSTS